MIEVSDNDIVTALKLSGYPLSEHPNIVSDTKSRAKQGEMFDIAILAFAKYLTKLRITETALQTIAINIPNTELEQFLVKTAVDAIDQISDE